MEGCLNLATFLSAGIENIRTPSENQVHIGEVFSSLLHHFKITVGNHRCFHISTMKSGGLGQSVTQGPEGSLTLPLCLRVIWEKPDF